MNECTSAADSFKSAFAQSASELVKLSNDGVLFLRAFLETTIKFHQKFRENEGLLVRKHEDKAKLVFGF